MKTQKHIAMAGILTVFAITLIVLAACDNPTKPAHTHDWGNWTQTIAATCTTAGEETRTCTLDPTHTEKRAVAIVPNAHNWQPAPSATAPTCTEDGHGDQICAYNAAHTQSGTIPKLGHDYQNYLQTTAPTCTTAGVETGTCTHDASHTTTRTITALGHNYQWVTTTTATCETAGVQTGTCTRDAVTTTRAVAINPNAHDWDWLVTNVNTSTGLIEETKTCTRCNDTDGIRTSLYYNIGDTGPGGGKIFYRSETGFTMTDDNSIAHYLEAAPDDMGSSTMWWASSVYISPSDGGTGEYIYIDGTETAIGAGRKNTALILAKDSNAPPAKACNEYEINGINDWFLPSFDELDQLYENRDYFNNLQSFWYWSSSEWGLGSAGIIGFHSGGKHNSMTKYSVGYARAIRAF